MCAYVCVRVGGGLVEGWVSVCMWVDGSVGVCMSVGACVCVCGLRACARVCMCFNF